MLRTGSAWQSFLDIFAESDQNVRMEVSKENLKLPTPGRPTQLLALAVFLAAGLAASTTPTYAEPKPKVAQDLQCPVPCVSAAEVDADVATQADIDALRADLDAEIAARQAGDVVLQSNIDTLDQRLQSLEARVEALGTADISEGAIVVQDSFGEIVGPLFDTGEVLIQAEGRNFHALLTEDGSGFKTAPFQGSTGVILFVDPACEGDAYIVNPDPRIFPVEPAWVGNGLLYALDPNGLPAVISVKSTLRNNNCEDVGFVRDAGFQLVVVLDLDVAFTPPLNLDF